MREGWGRGAGDVEGLLVMTYTGRRSPKVYFFRNRPFHLFCFVFLFCFVLFFSTFDMDKLRKPPERTF